MTTTTATPVHQRHIVIPGQIITTSASEEGGFLRGHGTYVEGKVSTTSDGDGDGDDDGADEVDDADRAVPSRLVASVAGTVERVNRLLSVAPFSSSPPYAAQVGDLVVGRVTAVRANRSWRVRLSSDAREAVLPLTGVDLPGGAQRVRTGEDARGMRRLFVEGDLVVAEVAQARRGDGGACVLHTRSLRYGRLENGCVVDVPARLVVRQKRHYATLNLSDARRDADGTSVDDADAAGVDLVLGCNGLVWIQRSPPRSWTSAAVGGGDDDDTVPLAETLQRLKRRHAETPATPEEREMVARVRNAVEALKFVHCRVAPETVTEVYRASKDAGLRVKDMLRPDAILAITRGTRRQRN